MAIEIRQLVIRAVVDAGAQPQSTAAERRAAAMGVQAPGPREMPGKPGPTTTTAIEMDADERQAIVNACVREVMRKLERARER